MNIYLNEYRQKLTIPQKAVEKLKDGDRSLVKVGLEYFVPNYFHQVPRLCRDFMEIDCTVTTV